MFKNVASQKVQVFAFTPADGLPKTGDAAQITVYVSKDHGSVTALTDTSAAEMDATNAPGVYVFDVAQAETNADELTFSGKSSTSGVKVVPRFISTNPANFTATSINSSGQLDVIKVNGTSQTAGDIVDYLATTGAKIVSGSRAGIRKNTALANFPFLMTDSTNHNPATGLTITVTRAIDNGSFSGGTLGSVSAISNGMYRVDFGAGDLNGDTITLRATATGADDTFVSIKTSP